MGSIGDDGTLRRSYKFRLRPTCQQESNLNEMFGDFCDMYNAALQERRDAWKMRQVSVSKAAQSADLPWIRKNLARHGRWSAWAQQEVLSRLDRSFDAFFRRVKAGQTPGYPRFKAKARWDSAVLCQGNGARWLPDTSRIAVVGIGHIKVHAHRQINGRVKTITVKREGRRWFAVFSCDRVPAQHLEPTGNTVGVDVGINVFAATSDNELLDNPRHGRRSAAKLADLQRAHAATGRRSVKRRQQIGELHRKIARQRRDHHHKTARHLVNNYDLVAVEALPVVNMVHRAKPKPDPDNPGTFLPNGGSAKTGLNRSIHDAGWAQFLNILDAKAEEAGRQVVRVAAHHTSQTCHRCGSVDPGNRTGEAFHCRTCGLTGHADINAAINIHRRGLSAITRQAA